MDNCFKVWSLQPLGTPDTDKEVLTLARRPNNLRRYRMDTVPGIHARYQTEVGLRRVTAFAGLSHV